MIDLILDSKQILEKAIADFKPNAIVMMFSGGDDSLTAYHVAKELGIKIDFTLHGNTRTGIPETTSFARKEAERLGDNYIEADARDSYENYVIRKGFFGKGISAHTYSYHVLKAEHFRKAVSKHIRQRQRGFKIMFINGARRKESANRLITMKEPTKIMKSMPNDMWVNIINEWDKPDCKDYLEGNGIKRNEVSVNLCRSGECMCGTMQSKGDRTEAAYFYPAWGKWLNDLEKKVYEKHGFGWNDNITVINPNQLKLDFQPMCTGCKVDYENNLEVANDIQVLSRKIK